MTTDTKTKQIWTFKPQITNLGQTEVEIPEGFKILLTAPWGTNEETGADMFKVWAEVDIEAPTRTVNFFIVGTGQPIPVNAEHLLTWPSGPFFWHLYADVVV